MGFEWLDEVLIFRAFVADDAGLLATFFEVGDECVGQATIGPRQHLQSINSVVVKLQTLRSDLLAAEMTAKAV